MKCLKCETIYPNHHDRCPKCKSKKADQVKYGHRHKKQEEQEIVITAFVESSEITAGEFRSN